MGYSMNSSQTCTLYELVISNGVNMPTDEVKVDLQNSGGMPSRGADWTNRPVVNFQKVTDGGNVGSDWNNRPVVHLQKISDIGNVGADWNSRPLVHLRKVSDIDNVGTEWTNRPERHSQNGDQMPIGGITIDLQNNGVMPNAGQHWATNRPGSQFQIAGSMGNTGTEWTNIPDRHLQNGGIMGKAEAEWTNRPERHLQNGGGIGNTGTEWVNRQGNQHGRSADILTSAVGNWLTDVPVPTRNTEWGGGTANSNGQSLQSSSNQNSGWLDAQGNINGGWIDMAGDRLLFDRVGTEELHHDIAVGGNPITSNGRGTTTETIGLRDSSIGSNGGEQFLIDVGSNIPTNFAAMDSVGRQVIGRPNLAHLQQRHNWAQPLERQTTAINPSDNSRTTSNNAVGPMVLIVHLQGNQGTEKGLSNVGNVVPSTGVNGLPVSRNMDNRNLLSNVEVGGGKRSNVRLAGQRLTDSPNMFTSGSERRLGMTKSNFNSRRFGNPDHFGDTRSNSIMPNRAQNINKFFNRQRMSLNGLYDAKGNNFNVNGVQKSLDGMSIDTSNSAIQRPNMLDSNFGAFGKIQYTPIPQALRSDPWYVSSLTERRDFGVKTRPNGDPSSMIYDSNNRLVRQKDRLYGHKGAMQLYGKPKGLYGTRNAKYYGKQYVPNKKRYGKSYKKHYGKKGGY
ncbi:Hypothetical predicted protein [Mytilus galloprovincialis]|uniref:Uncharacterized protein n=1 Tax=Mytilus galloprovincialis TaxID=29158 RepID=A0A8B6D5Q4_MYTGA|nr:Hypothetical predicted protein [Mytilus galloprovincialis]